MLKAISFLSQLKITKKTPIVISVSGGVDSISLLHLLVSYNYKVIVVHFNHHTRDTNDVEAALVESLAKQHNLKYYLFDVNVTTGNFQSEARNIRYNYLREVAEENNTKYIATAHHLDDLAETVLMKITRGSNLYGYAGIHQHYNQDGFVYIKPLLEYSKKEIINYANQYSLKYMDDNTNYLDHYTRNRIRNTIIPILKQENNNFLNKVYSYHLILKNSFEFIRKYANKQIKNGEVNITSFNKQDEVIQDEIIAVILEQNNISPNLNLMNDLKKIIKSKKPNLSYDLGNDYLFIKSYDTFFIKQHFISNVFKIVLDKENNLLPNMKNITFLDNKKSNNKNNVKICYNKLSLPLIARTREDGDVLKFPFGSKKLKDYFIDKKIPKLLRDELIVITDSNNTIVYVEGVYINTTLGNKQTILFTIV